MCLCLSPFIFTLLYNRVSTPVRLSNRTRISEKRDFEQNSLMNITLCHLKGDLQAQISRTHHCSEVCLTKFIFFFCPYFFSFTLPLLLLSSFFSFLSLLLLFYSSSFASFLPHRDLSQWESVTTHNFGGQKIFSWKTLRNLCHWIEKTKTKREQLFFFLWHIWYGSNLRSKVKNVYLSTLFGDQKRKSEKNS